jgi:DNA repair protein RadC
MAANDREITFRTTDERPRERLFARGVEALSDAELLALVLRSAGGDSLRVAVALLDRFGTLRALFAAAADRLLRERGLGPAGTAALLAVPALAERALRAELLRPVSIGAATDVGRFLRLRLAGREREVFAALFLDSQHRLIEYRELFLGTLDSATVHPREVLRYALELNAAAVILAHNHPSGVAEPSRADIALTERLRSVLALVDIRLLDHLVVVPGLAVSFAERGLI